jgi:hypothetical protein
MSLRPDLNSTYSDPLSRASASRAPAANVTHNHAQDPNIRTTILGAGDRAIEDHRRALLDPLGLSTPAKQPAAPPQSSSATWARMPVFAPPVRQAAPVPARRVEPTHAPGVIPPLPRSQAKDRAAAPDWFDPTEPQADGGE